MFMRVINNLFLITASGMTGGLLCLIGNDLLRKYVKREHVKNVSINESIVEMFNVGFYAGTAVAIFSIIRTNMLLYD